MRSNAVSPWPVCVAVALFALCADMPAQERLDPATLVLAQPGLQAVPLPSLDAVEPVVASQIHDALQLVRERGSARTIDRAELAAAYGGLGRVYQAYEFFEAAAACYHNARQLAPRDYRWPHLLGVVLEQTGGFAQAIDVYLEALRLEPEDHAARLRLGQVYLQLDRRGEARTQFDDSRSRFPASSQAGLGEIALREGRFQDALRLFEDALRRAPHATALHYSVGMAYRGLGRLEEARAHLTRTGRGRVRASDPLVDALPGLLTGVRALLNQGRIELEAGANDTAAALFRRAAAAAPDSLEARTGLAAALERLGDPEGAFAELTEAARRLPGSADAQRQLARAQLSRGREDAALGTLERVLALDAADEESLLQLTILQADRRRFADAVERLEAAYRRFPDRDRTATTLARLLAAAPDGSLRNGARALDIATAVHGRTPAPVHAETVALALAELGRCAEALTWVKNAIAQAEREGDATEVRRLGAEAPRYERDPCR